MRASKTLSLGLASSWPVGWLRKQNAWTLLLPQPVVAQGVNERLGALSLEHDDNKLGLWLMFELLRAPAINGLCPIPGVGWGGIFGLH